MLLPGPRSFLRDVNPAGALAELIAVFREAGPRRWPVAALSVVATATLFSLIVGEEQTGLPRPPHILYIRSFAPGRSAAQIRAENIANQRHKERMVAAQRHYDAETRAIYKAIGRASGLDVDAIDRQARIDAAAEEKARAARLAALYGAGRVVKNADKAAEGVTENAPAPAPAPR